jgi:hypothetical protein
MLIPPTELVIFDFDGTLLKSPASPSGHTTWHHHAYSLESVQEGPGFDRRWILPIIVEARRASLRPGTMTVVLTARPDSKGMRHAIKRLVGLTGIDFDAVQLKSVAFPGSSALYKAGAVTAWLERHPTIQKVTFFDDLESNLMTVEQAVTRTGRQYAAVQGPGL